MQTHEGRLRKYLRLNWRGKGLTLRALAHEDRTGISRAMLSQLERGERAPSAELRRRLDKVLAQGESLNDSDTVVYVVGELVEGEQGDELHEFGVVAFTTAEAVDAVVWMLRTIGYEAVVAVPVWQGGRDFPTVDPAGSDRAARLVADLLTKLAARGGEKPSGTEETGVDHLR